jgi:hypothetical protein
VTKSFALRIRRAEAPSPRLNWGVRLVVALALSGPLALWGGGLPEPDLVLYGAILDLSGGDQVRLTAGTLNWTFQLPGAGKSFAVTAALTNINDQFSYVARIPCETPITGFTAADGTLSLGSAYDQSLVSVDNHPATFVQAAQQTLTLAATDRGRIERVDLRVSIGGSGLLPENWQTQYFGHTGIDPHADPDHDGMDNLAEYRAGTNPLDASSVFAIETAENAVGGPGLTWASVAGRVYTVQRSQDLLTGFQDLAVDLAATPPRNSFQDTTASGLGPVFYRLTAKPAGP